MGIHTLATSVDRPWYRCQLAINNFSKINVLGFHPLLRAPYHDLRRGRKSDVWELPGPGLQHWYIYLVFWVLR